jgi:hypothetical protein
MCNIFDHKRSIVAKVNICTALVLQFLDHVGVVGNVPLVVVPYVVDNSLWYDFANVLTAVIDHHLEELLIASNSALCLIVGPAHL